MKITKGTIIRTIILAIVLINMVLKTFGVDLIPTNENAIASAVETLVEIGAIAASWWYNNSFTEKARKADEFFQQLKESESELENDDSN